MSKNPPTLADACIATALDKRMAGGPGKRNETVRRVLLKVNNARKFVLDQTMSEFLAVLSNNFWSGGSLRKRNRMLENARQMARLPHSLSWFEFSYSAAYFAKLKAMSAARIVSPTGVEPERFGWLVQQHPKIETGFIATEFRTSMVVPGRAFTHPVSMMWCSDNSPLPWQQLLLFPGEAADLMVMMEGYQTPQAYWTGTYSNDFSRMMLEAMLGDYDRDALTQSQELSVKPHIALRDLWALLATINDLPVTFERVEPSKGYMARGGGYKKFLQHTVLHLTVPETRWRKLVGKTAAILRRRAHQVRGHWRKDWRSPLASLCEHDFDDHMKCRRCSGHKIWIAEHQRGDASVGFVTHDYEVHHE